MQLINSEYIRTLNPCEEGIENFETQYPNFEGTIVDILKLDNVPFDDKVWLATKVVDLKTLQLWSVECAESVLHIYEKEFPNDKRVRECLEVTRKVINGELPVEDAENVDWSAAESAAESALSAAMSTA